MPRVLLLTLTLALLAGCAAGPDYQPPEETVPDVFLAAAAEPDQALSQQRFWQGFEDPLLARLIDQTLAANPSLQGALAGYERAAALLYGAERDRWPSVTASASVAEQHLAEVEQSPPGSGPDHVQRFQTGIAASWELDLFCLLYTSDAADE